MRDISLARSKGILRNDFLSISLFSGDTFLSYVNVVMQFFPVSSPTSLLYISYAGLSMRYFPVGLLFSPFTL